MGLDRRMQLLGKKDINGSQCIFVDDYGHHPTEIDKTIEAIKDSYQGFKLVMIFQPHRYTRTQDLFDEFENIFKKSFFRNLFFSNFLIYFCSNDLFPLKYH